ncbi:MAG TPA: adenylate/guanylate cyclase domain-containing protein [Rhizomicrobium sp.]|nr:adenylate/guanylate cyclase domain-containing protein [Rhizomicrobium sp.]
MNEVFGRLRALARNKSVFNGAVAAAIAVIVAALSMLAVDHVSFLTGADRFVQDWEIAFTSPPEPQDPNILIVAVDEGTMQHFPYRSPLDRGFLAQLLATLDAKHPRAIVLDYLFDQPTEPKKDEALRNVLHSMRTPLVVSYFEAGTKVSEQQTAYLNNFVPARARALANVGTDQTDTVRWIIPGGRTSSGEYLMSVPRRAAQLAGVQTPDEQVPIVWRADQGLNQPAFAQIPACIFGLPTCVLTASILPAATFRNKIVLVGSDLNLVDHHRTPFATNPGDPRGSMAGIVTFAHAIAQLLENRDPPQLSWWNNLIIALVLAFVGAALGLLDHSLWIRGGAVLGLVLALWLVGVFVLYQRLGILIALISPSIALIGSFAAVDSVTGLDARRQREFIHNTFSLYVSPSFVQQLVDDPSKLKLGGERREMTFLFTDIANFTTMSEGLDSKEVGHILNRYLDGMTGLVKKFDGTVDKFIGDSVFAIFNAPLDVEDHASKAVRCMLEMDRFTEAFRRKIHEEGVPLGETRIGVNTGVAAVGNFGSSDRFSYTASGDAVNASSRLEGLNKHFSTRLCVGHNARVLCKGVTFRPMGSVILKGKTSAVDVWEPLHDDAYGAEYLARYEAAFAAARDQAPGALEMFARLAAERPDDPMAAFYSERLREGEAGIEIKMTEK